MPMIQLALTLPRLETCARPRCAQNRCRGAGDLYSGIIFALQVDNRIDGMNQETSDTDAIAGGDYRG